ncbi:MAG TPA: hypothetical protein VF303_03465 [Candidatus Nanoarchaeia archaeon]
MPDQKVITIDIGSAWTKVFLVSLDSENTVKIEKSARLPTSWGDFSLATNLLLSKISENGVPKIFVSHFLEIEKLASKLGGDFVNEQAAAVALVKYFKNPGENFFILDAGASNLREAFQAENIGKYLTFAADPLFLENFIGKKRFKPRLLPLDTKELEIEEAFLRTNFQEKLSARNEKNVSLIALTGGMISGTPRLSRVALILLDVLGKEEITQVVFDREFFLPSFGALLTTYKRLQTAQCGAWLERLGTFVSLGESIAIELDWGYSQLQKVELAAGEISLIPAPSEQKIKLTLALGNKEKKRFDIVGGSLGILLDARTKPLPLVFGQNASRNLVAGWLKQIEEAEITKEAF